MDVNFNKMFDGKGDVATLYHDIQNALRVGDVQKLETQLCEVKRGALLSVRSLITIP